MAAPKKSRFPYYFTYVSAGDNFGAILDNLYARIDPWVKYVVDGSKKVRPPASQAWAEYAKQIVSELWTLFSSLILSVVVVPLAVMTKASFTSKNISDCMNGLKICQRECFPVAAYTDPLPVDGVRLPKGTN